MSGTIYVRLSSRCAGDNSWSFVDYSYTGPVTCASAQMTSPANGASIQPTTTFTWNTGTGNSEYWLQAGTTVRGTDIYSASQLTGTSRALTNLPSGTIYVRLSSRCAGSNTWSFTDYSYTVINCAGAQMTSPANGASIPAATTFTWNTGTGNSEYWLAVGTTVGGSDIYSASQLTGTSRTLNGLPSGTIYVRLSSRCGTNNAWSAVDYTYIGPSANCTQAQMTSPANGSTIAGLTVFNWNAGAGNTEYWLQVGTTGVGSNNLYSASQLTGMSRTLSNLPSGAIYVRLSSRCGTNNAWSAVDYTYIGPSANCTQAQMTSPANGSTIAVTTTFTWNTGTGNTDYWLQVGTTGVGSNNLYSSSQLGGTSRTLSGLPAGATYVRLSSRCGSNSSWSAIDYTYTVATNCTQAQMTSPTNGSTIAATTTFTWNTGTGNSEYWLQAGTTVGGTDIYSASQLTGTSRALSNLPSGTIYVRLSSRCAGNNTWSFTDYSYTVGCNSTPAQMTSPANGASIPAATTFTWNTGTGNSEYWLAVGTTLGGSDIYSASQLTGTSRTLSNLPSANIYVTLSSRCGATGEWSAIQYSYTGPDPRAQMISPAAGAVLPSSIVNFTWTRGIGNTQNFLYVGNSPGSSEFFYDHISNGSTTVTGIPTDGRTIHVRLWSLPSSGWTYLDYTYSACASCGNNQMAQITNPANGATFGSSAVTFSWNPGTGNSQYVLYVGNSQGSSEYFYEYISGGSTAVSGLPTDGRTIWVRIWSFNGQWLFTDYSFKASG